MTPERFAELLDRRGPALARWPAADRAAAEALLAGSPAARAALAEARALDAALRGALPRPDPAALARLQDRIARSIARAPLPAPSGLLARLRAALHPAAPAGWGRWWRSPPARSGSASPACRARRWIRSGRC
ncbi:hypothetical protein ACFQU2_06060 [Siccirubricoccus deserti]